MQLFEKYLIDSVKTNITVPVFTTTQQQQLWLEVQFFNTFFKYVFT